MCFCWEKCCSTSEVKVYVLLKVYAETWPTGDTILPLRCKIHRVKSFHLWCEGEVIWYTIVWAIWWFRHKVGGISSQLLRNKTCDSTNYSSITVECNICHCAPSDTTEAITCHCTLQSRKNPHGSHSVCLFFRNISKIHYANLTHYTDIWISDLETDL